MAYEVVLHPTAARELDRVPHEIFRRIDAAVWSLREQPRPIGVRKLQGELHRIRIGDWRIIYAILDRERRIIIVRVTRRSEKTYKGL